MDDREQRAFRTFRIHYAFAWTATCIAAFMAAFSIWMIFTEADTKSISIGLVGSFIFAVFARLHAREEQKTLQGYYGEAEDEETDTVRAK